MTIKDKIKELTKKKQLTAVEVYAMTKYGEPLNEEQIFKRYVQNIDEMLETKSMRGYYSLVIDADSRFPEISSKVIDLYIGRGFNCFLLDGNIDSRINTPQIFIGWKD